MNTLPYKFRDIEREIRFDRFDLPQPWINYLSNGKMHAFVSQAGGGMAWWPSGFPGTAFTICPSILPDSMCTSVWKMEPFGLPHSAPAIRR